MSDPSAVFDLDPDDLDGHSIEQLEDYLDRGRTPADPTIDGSPACLLALDALERVRELARRYLEGERSAPRDDQAWIDVVVAAIPFDVRPGRRFPIPADDPDVEAWVTEAAVRGLIRSIGDEVDGLLVGSADIGDEEPKRLRVVVAVVYGTVIATAVDRLRSALLERLPWHLPFRVGAIDIRVAWVIEAPRDAGRR